MPVSQGQYRKTRKVKEKKRKKNIKKTLTTTKNSLGEKKLGQDHLCDD
jgi:hypothetical protein